MQPPLVSEFDSPALEGRFVRGFCFKVCPPSREIELIGHMPFRGLQEREIQNTEKNNLMEHGRSQFRNIF